MQSFTKTPPPATIWRVAKIGRMLRVLSQREYDYSPRRKGQVIYRPKEALMKWARQRLGNPDISSGCYKLAFIFRWYVLKVDMSTETVPAEMERYRKHRRLCLPTYEIAGVMIQPRVKFTSPKLGTRRRRCWSGIFGDVHEKNYTTYKGRVVMVDFGGQF